MTFPAKFWKLAKIDPKSSDNLILDKILHLLYKDRTGRGIKLVAETMQTHNLVPALNPSHLSSILHLKVKHRHKNELFINSCLAHISATAIFQRSLPNELVEIVKNLVLLGVIDSKVYNEAIKAAVLKDKSAEVESLVKGLEEKGLVDKLVSTREG